MLKTTSKPVRICVIVSWVPAYPIQRRCFKAARTNEAISSRIQPQTESANAHSLLIDQTILRQSIDYGVNLIEQHTTTRSIVAIEVHEEIRLVPLRFGCPVIVDKRRDALCGQGMRGEHSTAVPAQGVVGGVADHNEWIALARLKVQRLEKHSKSRVPLLICPFAPGRLAKHHVTTSWIY